MEATVKQCSVDKKYFDIQKKELSLDNDRLLDYIICQDVMNIVMYADSVPVNVLSNNKCLVNDNLESERLKQENDHLSVLLLSQDIVHICVNSLATLTNYAKMEQDYIDEYTKLNEKDVSIANLRKQIESLKGKNVVEKDATSNKAKELVEHARALRPLDSDLDSACKYVQRIQEMLVYVAATCPSLSKPSEKLVAVIPLNKKKKLGMKSSTSASRSQPSGNTKNNRISQTAS
ncbi:hypothetical protein Tco_1116978, partial [Tanacetum coccineum]